MDIAKLLGGPCVVLIDDVDVGSTKDGVTVESDVEFFDFVTDQTGSRPVKKVVNGGRDRLIINLAEFSLENLAKALPNAVLITEAGPPEKKRLEIRTQVGLEPPRVEVVIKAIDSATGAASTNPNFWVTAPLASPDGSTVSLRFASAEQRVITLNFECFPDPDNDNRTIFFGDATAVAP